MLFHFCSFVCSGYEWVGWESFLIGIRRITQWILSFGFMASILYLRFLLFYPTIGGTILFLLPISVFGSSSLWLWYFSRVPLPAVCVLAEVDFLSEFSSVPFSFFFSFVIFSLACWILQMLFLSFYVLRYFVVFRIALCICLPNLRGGTIFSPFFFWQSPFRLSCLFLLLWTGLFMPFFQYALPMSRLREHLDDFSPDLLFLFFPSFLLPEFEQLPNQLLTQIIRWLRH